MQVFEMLKLDPQGLVTAVVQDQDSGEVLMLAHMSPESLEITLQEGIACFWSRSRQELWRKGESSGNVLNVKEIRVDCDADAVLLKCKPRGPACHTNETSCFYRKVLDDGAVVLDGDGVAAS